MNLKRLKNGKWQVRWRDKNGRQRARNCRTKEIAQEELRLVMTGQEAEPEVATKMTFAVFAEQWHRDYCKVEKAETQWFDDLAIIKNHLVPAFGTKTLHSLALHDLTELRGRLKSAGKLKAKTINNITGLAKVMLETAVAWKLLRASPFSGLKRLKQDEVGFQFWTTEEIERVLNFGRRIDPEFAEVIGFTCHTGLRLGEVSGLKRDCLDFDRRVVVVRRSFNVKYGLDLERTKTRRIREVPLNDAALGIVRPKRLLAPTETVFRFDPGHASRRLKALAEVAEVKPIRFHDLRHSFASNLRIAGVPIDRVQALLGHSDIKQTMVYAHLGPDSLAGVTAVLVSARNVHSGDKRNASSRK